MKDIEIVQTTKTIIVFARGNRDYYISKHANGKHVMPARSQVANQYMTAFQLRQFASELEDLADACDQLDNLVIGPDDLRRGFRNASVNGEIVLEFEK